MRGILVPAENKVKKLEWHLIWKMKRTFANSSSDEPHEWESTEGVLTFAAIYSPQIDCKSRCQFWPNLRGNTTSSSPILCRLLHSEFAYIRCFVLQTAAFQNISGGTIIFQFDIVCWLRVWICKSNVWTKSRRPPIPATDLMLSLELARSTKDCIALLSSRWAQRWFSIISIFNF